MRKKLIQLIVVCLLPCLAVDPTLAVGISSYKKLASSPFPRTLYTQQAIPGALCGIPFRKALSAGATIAVIVALSQNVFGVRGHAVEEFQGPRVENAQQPDSERVRQGILKLFSDRANFREEIDVMFDEALVAADSGITRADAHAAMSQFVVFIRAARMVVTTSASVSVDSENNIFRYDPVLWPVTLSAGPNILIHEALHFSPLQQTWFRQIRDARAIINRIRSNPVIPRAMQEQYQRAAWFAVGGKWKGETQAWHFEVAYNALLARRQNLSLAAYLERQQLQFPADTVLMSLRVLSAYYDPKSLTDSFWGTILFSDVLRGEGILLARLNTADPVVIASMDRLGQGSQISEAEKSTLFQWAYSTFLAAPQPPVLPRVPEIRERPYPRGVFLLVGSLLLGAAWIRQRAYAVAVEQWLMAEVQHDFFDKDAIDFRKLVAAGSAKAVRAYLRQHSVEMTISKTQQLIEGVRRIRIGYKPWKWSFRRSKRTKGSGPGTISRRTMLFGATGLGVLLRPLNALGQVPRPPVAVEIPIRVLDQATQHLVDLTFAPQKITDDLLVEIRSSAYWQRALKLSPALATVIAAIVRDSHEKVIARLAQTSWNEPISPADRLGFIYINMRMGVMGRAMAQWKEMRPRVDLFAEFVMNLIVSEQMIVSHFLEQQRAAYQKKLRPTMPQAPVGLICDVELQEVLKQLPPDFAPVVRAWSFELLKSYDSPLLQRSRPSRPNAPLMTTPPFEALNRKLLTYDHLMAMDTQRQPHGVEFMTAEMYHLDMKRHVEHQLETLTVKTAPATLLWSIGRALGPEVNLMGFNVQGRDDLNVLLEGQASIVAQLIMRVKMLRSRENPVQGGFTPWSPYFKDIIDRTFPMPTVDAITEGLNRNTTLHELIHRWYVLKKQGQQVPRITTMFPRVSLENALELHGEYAGYMGSLALTDIGLWQPMQWALFLKLQNNSSKSTVSNFLGSVLLRDLLANLKIPLPPATGALFKDADPLTHEQGVAILRFLLESKIPLVDLQASARRAYEQRVGPLMPSSVLNSIPANRRKVLTLPSTYETGRRLLRWLGFHPPPELIQPRTGLSRREKVFIEIALAPVLEILRPFYQPITFWRAHDETSLKDGWLRASGIAALVVVPIAILYFSGPVTELHAPLIQVLRNSWLLHIVYALINRGAGWQKSLTLGEEPARILMALSDTSITSKQMQQIQRVLFEKDLLFHWRGKPVPSVIKKLDVTVLHPGQFHNRGVYKIQIDDERPFVLKGTDDKHAGHSVWSLKAVLSDLQLIYQQTLGSYDRMGTFRGQGPMVPKTGQYVVRDEGAHFYLQEYAGVERSEFITALMASGMDPMEGEMLATELAMRGLIRMWAATEDDEGRGFVVDDLSALSIHFSADAVGTPVAMFPDIEQRTRKTPYEMIEHYLDYGNGVFSNSSLLYTTADQAIGRERAFALFQRALDESLHRTYVPPRTAHFLKLFSELQQRRRRFSDEEAIIGFKASPTVIELIGVSPKNYLWGDPHKLPHFLGLPETGEPWGEWWLGAHPSWPATVILGRQRVELTTLLRYASTELMGESIGRRFGAEWPYLMKVLTFRKMLSLQAHPDTDTAYAGYAKQAEHPELPIIYTDPRGKIEKHVALEEMWMLHSFRKQMEILQVLRRPEFAKLAEYFGKDDTHPNDSWNGRGGTLSVIFSKNMRMPQEKADFLLKNFLGRLMRKKRVYPYSKNQHEYWALKAADELPPAEGEFDKSIFLIFMLNLLHLYPGQGTYQLPGTMHAYLEGMTVEAISNSDNVWRAGLTNKAIHVAELEQHVDFTSREPELLAHIDANSIERIYESPSEECVLSQLRVTKEHSFASGTYHSIDTLIVTAPDDEVVHVKHGQTHLRLKRGGSFLAPASVNYTITTEGSPVVLLKVSVPLVTLAKAAKKPEADPDPNIGLFSLAPLFIAVSLFAIPTALFLGTVILFTVAGLAAGVFWARWIYRQETRNWGTAFARFKGEYEENKKKFGFVGAGLGFVSGFFFASVLNLAAVYYGEEKLPSKFYDLLKSAA